MKRFLKLFCLAGIATGYAVSLSAAEEPARDGESLIREMKEFFAEARSRHPGSDGNLAAEQAVADLFASKDFPSGEINFPAPHFRTGTTTMTLPGDDGSIRLYPMHPTVMRPGNFKETSFDAPLVYMGTASVNDLSAARGQPLKDAIAVVEFDGGDDWMDLIRFGVRGFLFLGKEEYHHADLVTKIFGSEASVPRFFVDLEEAGPLRERLQQEGALTCHIDAEPTRWENRMLRDLWVLIPGADKDLQRDVVLIYAPLDSNAIVPDKAYGATSAANLHLLLRLFEEFSANPPQRSVMLAAVNAHTQLARGERLLAWNLLVPRSEVEAVQDVIATDLRVQQLYTRYYKQFDLTPPTSKDQELIEELRGLTDTSTGRNLSVKEPVVSLAKRQVNVRRAERLRIYNRIKDLEERDAKIAELETERQKYVNVLTLFNKTGFKTDLADLTSEEIDILRGYVDDIIQRNEMGTDLCNEELRRNAKNAEIRNSLKGRDVKFVMGLDLTWTAPRIGFSSYNADGQNNWQHKWGLNIAAIANRVEAQAIASGADRIFVDSMTRRGGLPESHYYLSASPGLTHFHAANQTPAFAARTPFAGHGNAFSPLDTFDALDAESVAIAMEFIPDLFREALADPNITNPTELRSPKQDNMWTVRLQTFKFDEFSASVTPDLPVAGTLLRATHGVHILEEYQPILHGNVINAYFALTDPRASTLLFGVFGNPGLNTAAFHFDPDFIHVDHTIDVGDAESKVTSNISKKTDDMRLSLFHCTEFPVYPRADSSLISIDPITTYEYRVLTGADDSSPKKYGISGARAMLSLKVNPNSDGPAAFFFPPGEPFKFQTRDKIVALNSSPEHPEGIGYASPAEMGPDFFAAAAEDMSYLNQHRLQKMEGVTDELSELFLERGNQALDTMRDRRAANDYTGTLRSLFEALGAQFKAYTQTSTITNDMLKAVVFYLALMLPFCFFVMKLMFKFVKVESQMAAFGVLFVGIFVIFRLIHPAFRIAEAPGAMFVAFIMGIIGLFVIKILHDRFEGEMQLLFNTYTGMDTTEVGYSTVGQEAMLIGVNNMKRRRLRTAFTTATIVLVTFTMLAFTSISKKLSPTLIRQSQQAPYTGLMYHWPGNEPMDEETARILTQNYGDRGDVITRRWILGRLKTTYRNPTPIPDRLAATTGEDVLIDGVLGLGSAEDGFLTPEMPMSYGRFFEADDAQEVVLPNAVADSLGITPDNYAGHRVRFRGHEFAIAGVLNDDLFEEIKDLNQRSIRPIKNLVQQQDQSGDAGMSSVEGDTPEKSGVFFVEMSSLLVMPVTTVQRLGGGPYSVSVRLDAEDDVWPAVDELLTMSRANKFYMGSGQPFSVTREDDANSVQPGVYYIGEGYRTSIGGLSFLIIPLLIASTIILNTMLGSVYERKNEISVYNAVGLNPTHIGMFFLAESFVYSVIGSVGGYLIGQILSIGLTKTGVISDINLNFSSLSVVYVILFTVTIVMLSTIYPSMVATKAAVPSGKRKWSIPDNDGQRMDVLFPFIYQPELILGILGYLHSYFSRFTEASFGDLISNLEGKETGTDEKGRPTYTISYHLALAPFDLGVTQQGRFHAAFDDRVQAYRVTLHIERISGQDTNWITTNKPFLEQLRTYLLHWRNLDAAEHALYVQQGEELFAE